MPSRMSSPRRPRSLAAAIAGVSVAVVLCGSIGAAAASGTTGRPAAGQPAVPLAAGQVGTRSAVPWRRVGAGWALAQYTRSSALFAPHKKVKPITLYLVDPAGGKYALYRWPATRSPWYLVDWSGDKTRALFIAAGTGSRNVLHQLVLATGAVSTFTLPANVSPIGYTRPDGKNLLAVADGIARYNLRGVFQARLARGTLEEIAISAADGLTEVVSGSRGLELVSNSGGLIRRLRVPGTAPRLGCNPVRWWSASTVLAACLPTKSLESRLWLVPVSGAAPKALTPIRKPSSHDYGDVDAWRLPSGLYLQALGPCGTEYIGKQEAGGSVKMINVPGGGANNNRIAAVTGRRMLVQVQTGCPGSDSLVWFNPATRAVQKVLTAPGNEAGVLTVVAYNRKGNQP